MRSLRFFAAGVLAVASLAALSLAQERPEGGRGRGGPGGGGMFTMFTSRMSLLRINEVRKELELVDEQVAAIEKIDEELRAKYPSPFGGRGGPPGGDGQRGRRGPGTDGQGALIAPAQSYFVAQNQEQPRRDQEQGRRGFGGPPPSDEERARFEQQRVERAREERAKLSEVLLPDQMKRLTEIYIQVAGVSSLQDEEVAKELGISDAQKSQLTKIRDEFNAKRRELGGRGGGGGGGGDFEAIRAKVIELTTAQDEQTLAVLSGQQKSKFAEMKGKPFAIPEGAGRGGPGGPGGGPGGNRTRRGNN